MEHVTIDLTHLFVLGLLTSSAHWLFARSKIAKPLWSRTRGFIDELLRCPACSGVWLAAGAYVAGVRPVGKGGPAFICTMLLGLILTPVFEGVLLWGLERSALEDADEVPPAQPAPPEPPQDLGEAITPLDRPTR